MEPKLLSVKQDVRLAACPECHSIYQIDKERFSNEGVFECFVCKGKVDKTITVGISDSNYILINGCVCSPMNYK